MELEDSYIFTGIQDTDYKIINQLDDQDLFNICQVNKYAFHLCKQSKTLKKRLALYTHKFDIFTGVPELDELILEETDDETLYNAYQINTYSNNLCINSYILNNRLQKYKFYLLVNKIINYVFINYKLITLYTDKSYNNIIHMLNNINALFIDTTNYNNYQTNIVVDKVIIGKRTYLNEWYIDIYYKDGYRKYVDTYDITIEQLQEFLFTTFNNHTFLTNILYN